MTHPRKHKNKPNGYSRARIISLRLDPVEEHFIIALQKEMSKTADGNEISMSDAIRVLIREKALPLLVAAGVKPDELDQYVADEYAKRRSAPH